MFKSLTGLLSAGALFMATFSSSPSYQLQNYNVGPGGTNTSQSTTYTTQSSTGQQANGTTSGTTYTAKNGSIQTEQLNTPPAPTLSNGSSTYYNKLSVIVNTGGNPSDSTYAIAASTNNFTTTNYVQTDGTLGATAVYRTYTAWGGASGSFMTGLSIGTTYQVKVAAKEGMFTNTAYGASASASTVNPSTTFSVSPNSISLGSLLPGSVITSSNLTFAFTTNGASGGAVYVSGSSSGLFSTKNNFLISALSANIAAQAQGFGVQATNASQTSGGPFTILSPFNGTGNDVGADSSVPQQIFSSSAPIVGGSANANFQAKAASTTPSGSDYQETLTFVAAGYF